MKEQTKQTEQIEQTVLPELLIFADDGLWEQPEWSKNPDDEDWTHFGWKIVDYEGNEFFRNKDESTVRQWLVDRDYKDTGDGYHYRLEKEDLPDFDALKFIDESNEELDNSY